MAMSVSASPAAIRNTPAASIQATDAFPIRLSIATLTAWKTTATVADENRRIKAAVTRPATSPPRGASAISSPHHWSSMTNRDLISG